MNTMDRLAGALPAAVGAQMRAWRRGLYEVRLRSGRPVQLRADCGEWLSDTPLEAKELGRLLSLLMDYSIYAREDELGRGFFTMADGCRVGVSGRLVRDGAVVAGIGSVCVRVSREVYGCADGLLPTVLDGSGRVRSTVLLSRPGLGKTTLLRELARRLSDAGKSVCVADERHELAACRDGVPTLDVGARTDVMDGGPRHVAIPMMLRAMAPEVIVCDEIGGAEDAGALAEAARCGVSVICSVHAGSFDQMYGRQALRGIAEIFEVGVLLDGKPGQVAEIRPIGEEWHACGVGAVRGGGLRALRERSGGVGQGEG